MLSGLAHVATVSFLASRIAPGGQFWVALAGGVALARAGARHGLRGGYGASLAAILETVALIGPARVNGPLTQALNAPVVGWLHAHRPSFVLEFAATLIIRLAHYVVLHVAFLYIVIGGLDTFLATYDKIAGWLPLLPEGKTAAYGLTIAGLFLIACGYSVVQVLVYRRALARWPDPPDTASDTQQADRPEQLSRKGSDPFGDTRPAAVPPRAVAIAVAAAAAWTAMLVWLTWPVLLAITAGLVVGWLALVRGNRGALKLGLALAALFAVGAVGPAILGAVGFEEAARRALRAALLVLVATWARAAAGAEGIRALSAALLWRARRVPAVAEASALAAVLRTDHRLAAAGQSLSQHLEGVPHQPLAVADAVTDWAAAEAAAVS